MFSAKTNFQASGSAVITPDNNADLPQVAYGIFVGVAGHVKVDMYGEGVGIVFKNVANGTFLPIQVKRVYATGTTATDMIALY